MPFLPITAEEMRARGWDAPDIVLVTGDAYVDHPSFGTAIISRVLEDAGFSVCILSQPQSDADYLRFGRPRLAFYVTAAILIRWWRIIRRQKNAAPRMRTLPVDVQGRAPTAR